MPGIDSPDARPAFFDDRESGAAAWDFEQGLTLPSPVEALVASARAVFSRLEAAKSGDLRDLMTAAGVTDLDGSDLRKADLSGQDLSSISFVGADFRGADLRGSRLAGCNLTMANFEGAALDGADFSKANIKGATGVRTARQGLTSAILLTVIAGFAVARLLSNRPIQAGDAAEGPGESGGSEAEAPARAAEVE